ncbi:MAG TPA: hypothetical protein VE819_10300 [Steroidobacteraceae bacterium]|jgi:hypothetical protein|nr:hypothetical protein [Steroidobacteraceae bacterium]
MSEGPKGARQPTDVNVHRVIIGAGIVVAAIVLALGVSRALLTGLGVGIQDPPRALRELPPTPREQMHPITDYQRYRAAEQAKLEAYAWVNRKDGIVQIPIERAMALVAKGETGARPADRSHR